MTRKRSKLPARSLSGQRGFVLVVVQVFIVMAFVMLAPSYERLHEMLRADKARHQPLAGGVGLDQAAGVGLARLQTGVPPSDDYTCTLKLWDSAAGDMVSFELHYTKLLVDRWSVQATQPAGADPGCPDQFEAVCPLVGG